MTSAVLLRSRSVTLSPAISAKHPTGAVSAILVAPALGGIEQGSQLILGQDRHHRVGNLRLVHSLHRAAGNLVFIHEPAEERAYRAVRHCDARGLQASLDQGHQERLDVL